MSAVLTIGGATINRVTARTTLIHCRPYAKDAYPTLAFARCIGTLTPGLDPWDGQPVTLTQDGTLIFAGDAGTHLTHYDAHLGWVREWTCYGLARRAEYIPVTDSLTLTDTIRYNLPPDDPDYLPSRAGRTMGQIVADVLEMPQNKAALSAAGVGNYSSAGTGAEATCSISGGAVTGATVPTGGSGYTVAPAVLFSSGGGSGATGTATVSGGAVTGISITSGGSGYISAPVVTLSTLPALTLSDIDGLTIIPPFEVDVQGERILQALEGVAQSCHPNHFVQVDPQGNIRFLDPRTFAGAITLVMDGSDPRVGRPAITADWSGCYTACQVRGNSLVVPVTLSLQPWPGSAASNGGLQEDFAHDGLTNSQAKAQWRATDFTMPTQSQGTATATANVTSGVITAINVVLSGYNYTTAPTVQITDPTGTGAAATASISGGAVTAIAVTSGGSGYSSTPTVTLTGPAVGQSDVGSCTMPSTTQVTVTSANPKANWPADYWDYSPTGHQGVIVLQSDTITGYNQFFTARIIANTALTPGGTSTLTIDSPAPATTYNSYQIYGTAGGASFVYRRYQVTNAAIAAQMTNGFPYPVAYRNSDGTAATLTSTPAGTVFYSQSGSPPYEQSSIGVTCDAESGTILTARPTALVFSADGVTPTPVNDVQAFVPVNTGALEVRSPATGYQGTAFTKLGIARTKVITCLDWKDSSNTLNMTVFASEYLATVQDIVYEGSLPYFGLLAAALTVGQKLNITGSTYPTGWDSFAIPIIAVELEYRERSGATQYLTTVTFSNRRAPLSGAALKRPAVLGQPFGIGQTELRSGLPPPTVPSAAGQGSPAAAASDQDGAMGSISGDPTAPVAATGGGLAPSDSLAASLPEGSQASATDSLADQTDSASAPPSGSATLCPETGLADEPADDEGRPERRVRFVDGRTSQFVRKPPSFRPRAADTFARNHSRPDVDSVSGSSDDAEPVPLTNQHHATKTTQANPTTNSSKGSPNDQTAEKVPRRFDGRMGGLAVAKKTTYLQKILGALSRRLRKVPDTLSGPTETLGDISSDTSSDPHDHNQGLTTYTDDSTSNASGMTSSTETSSGTESFSGIDKDDTDFSGPSTFTKNDFDSTIHAANDASDTTTGASNRLNGTDTSDDDKLARCSDGRQDVDQVSAPGGDAKPVTLTDQAYGTKMTAANPTTSDSEGTPTYQGGTTVQTSQTHSVTGPGSSTDVSTGNSDSPTPAGRKISTNSSGSAHAQFTPADEGSSNGGGGKSNQAPGQKPAAVAGLEPVKQEQKVPPTAAQMGRTKRKPSQRPSAAPPAAATPPGPRHVWKPWMAIPRQAWESLGLGDPEASLMAGSMGAAINQIAAPRAARRLLPAVRKIKPEYADVKEKQLAGDLQHVLWLAMMHLHVGETKARKIAWIHEQYGSDGWSDTLKDFYNNNVGIRIGKEIEQEIGPDGMRLYLSQGADDTGRWNPSLVNPTIPPNRRFPAVEAQILGLLRAKMEKSLLDGTIAVKDTDIDKARLRSIIPDARRFWDTNKSGNVIYSQPPAKESDRPPPLRP